MTLYAMGIPVTVTVDDYLPFDNSFSDPSFGNIGDDNSLWGPLLEKAAAKLFGNYELLEGGWMGPAMQTLTGAPYFDMWHYGAYQPSEADKIWDFVNEKIRNGWLVCSSTPGLNDQEVNELGIANMHAYTVLDTV